MPSGGEGARVFIRLFPPRRPPFFRARGRGGKKGNLIISSNSLKGNIILGILIKTNFDESKFIFLFRKNFKNNFFGLVVFLGLYVLRILGVGLDRLEFLCV